MTMSAFLLAAALLSPLQEAWEDAQIVQLAPPWDHIVIGDWTYIGQTNGGRGILFFQPARQRGKVWVRYEFAEPRHGYRSTRALVEVECDSWRTRTIQAASFTINNLEGEGMSGGPSSWEEAAPNTVADATLDYGCGD